MAKCQACEEGRHWDCGMQTCECDCDPELALSQLYFEYGECHIDMGVEPDDDDCPDPLPEWVVDPRRNGAVEMLEQKPESEE